MIHPVPKPPRTPRKPRRPLQKAKAKPRARNGKRHNREWMRAFGSAERVAFIAAHARDCDGPIENTHTIGGGMGRRSDAEHIVPCCRRHHHELHSVGAPFFEMHRAVNVRACAAETRDLWQAHVAATGGEL